MASLNPYTSVFAYKQAAHLLRRASFNPTHEAINWSVSNGLDMTLSQLFEPSNIEPPVHHDSSHPNYEKTWQNSLVPSYDDSEVFRVSIMAWLQKNLLEEKTSIQEKMRLFWHSHFCVAQKAVNNAHYIAIYFDLLKEYSLGNFKAFIKKMTLDHAMLKFLSGRFNTGNEPNENYARELLELFTVGKGPIAGPGDYTNYTEADIKEITKILSGWVSGHYYNTDGTVGYEAKFQSDRHNEEIKTLSHRFDNIQIPNMDDEEYSFLIDRIFDLQAETTAKFICKKLYIFFVNSYIDQEIQFTIIDPLAQIFIESDFEILPVVQTLLQSEHFFDDCNIGTKVKSPIDFHTLLFKQLNFPLPPGTTEERYNAYLFIVGLNRKQLMDYAFPPNVAGWKAYYQEPAYDRLWINADSLQRRKRNLSYFTHGTANFGHNLKPNLIALIRGFEKSEEPEELVKSLIDLFLSNPLNQTQVDYLKNILTSPTSEDYYWTEIYTRLDTNPGNTTNSTLVVTKLRSLMLALLELPEYHLM